MIPFPLFFSWRRSANTISFAWREAYVGSSNPMILAAARYCFGPFQSPTLQLRRPRVRKPGSSRKAAIGGIQNFFRFALRLRPLDHAERSGLLCPPPPPRKGGRRRLAGNQAGAPGADQSHAQREKHVGGSSMADFARGHRG